MFGSCAFYSSILLVIGVLVLALLAGFLLGQGRKRAKEAASDCRVAASEEEVEAGAELEKTTAVPADCLSSAEIAGSPISTSLYQFDTLLQLSVAGYWQVKLACNASENYCRVTAETKLLRNVKVEFSRGGLLVRYTGKKRPALPMTLEIKCKGMPEAVKSNGENSVVIEGVRGEALVCKVANRGRFLINDATLDECKCKVADRSQLDFRGTVTRLDLDLADAASAKFNGKFKRVESRISGASKLEIGTVRRGEFEVSGASRVNVEASERLEGDVTGASTVKYSGAVTNVNFNTSGSSRVSPAVE